MRQIDGGFPATLDEFYSVKTVSFLAHLVDELRSGYPLDLLLVKDGGSVEPGIVKGTINQV